MSELGEASDEVQDPAEVWKNPGAFKVCSLEPEGPWGAMAVRLGGRRSRPLGLAEAEAHIPGELHRSDCELTGGELAQVKSYGAWSLELWAEPSLEGALRGHHLSKSQQSGKENPCTCTHTHTC